MFAVAAPGAGDVWALGWSTSGACLVDLEHWDGSTWVRVRTPRGVATSAPIAASSARDLWIFPDVPGLAGGQPYVYNYALVWNGNRWHALRFPRKLTVRSALVFGPADVWVFGTVHRRSGGQYSYAVRYDGYAWHKVVLPGVPLSVSATGPDDIWAVGPSGRTAHLGAARQVILAMRWNGRKWRPVQAPALAIPGGVRFSDRSGLAAINANKFYWAYLVTNGQGPAAAAGMLAYDRGRWSKVRLPVHVVDIAGMTQDGAGGLWMTAFNPNLTQYWLHYGERGWDRQLVVSPRGYNGDYFAMASVPGTRLVWAVGQADANNGNTSEGIIAEYVSR